MIRRNNEAQTASETNSTNDVGPAPDQAGYQLDCTEVWGGNNVADKLVELPGLVGLIHSKPVEPATSGGDLYYVSTCDKRLLSRVVLADVAGHGEAVGGISTRLRRLVEKYINTFDQSALMREINEAFYKQNEDLAQYATAVVLSHDCRTGELIFASAGHPPTLWYHASQKEWGWLHERTTDSVETLEGLPLDLSQEPNMNRRVCGLPKAICSSCTRTESRNVQTRRTRSWVTKVYATCYAIYYQWNPLSRQHPRW